MTKVYTPKIVDPNAPKTKPCISPDFVVDGNGVCRDMRAKNLPSFEQHSQVQQPSQKEQFVLRAVMNMSWPFLSLFAIIIFQIGAPDFLQWIFLNVYPPWANPDRHLQYPWYETSAWMFVAIVLFVVAIKLKNWESKF